MKRLFATFFILLIFSFCGFFILEDRVAGFRVAELLNMLDSNQQFTSRSSDFHLYATLVYYLTFGFYSIIGERLSCLLVNTFLVSLSITIFSKYIFNNRFSVIPGTVIYPFDGSLYFYYFSFNLPLLVYLSSSLRDSFLYSIITLFLLSISTILNSNHSNKFRITLRKNILFFLPISLILLFLIIQTRPQVSIIILLSVFLTYGNISLLNLVFNIFNYLINIIKLRINIIYKIRKNIFLSILSLFLAILISFPIASNFVDKLNSIAGDQSNYNIISAISSYQVKRISRNDDTSINSSDVIQDTDEYENTNFIQRIALQSLNLIFTPLNFKFKFFHILSMLDSIISIFLMYLFFYIFRRSNLDLGLILNKCPFALVSSNFAIISFAAYSILISNGGNAFRYKQHWLPFLLISFGQILYFCRNSNYKLQSVKNNC